jgi:SWI/SNF-related matrix-associated actin-dependent regulator of chromatin subfamily A-like protein 1
MQLDYIAKTNLFVLTLPRVEATIELTRSLMQEHGFNYSTTGSSPGQAMLFTEDAYAAASFEHCATPAAKAQMADILTQIKASWAPGSTKHYRIPADMQLWPFQSANLDYALSRKNTLIADQPGLGKTPTSIAFCNEVRAKRVLVLCPANIRLQWVKRIREWTTMPWPYGIHTILTSRSGVHPTAAWTVTSYEMARTPAIAKALAKGRYDVLILDEGHYLKSVDSLRTRSVFGGGERAWEPLASRCERVLALTGTPLPNRPREAYTLARGLCWDSIDWSSEDTFRDRYNPSAVREVVDRYGRVKKFIDERTGRHFELQNRLRANFMVRHLKADVLTQLPEVLHDVVQMEETGPVKQALKAERMLDIDPETFAAADMTVMGHISQVRHKMGVALAPQAADYVAQLLDGGEDKIVVFAHHLAVLDILQERLGRHGVVRIDGGSSTTQRAKAIKDFREDEGIKVLIGNLQSMGTGTDGLQDVCSHSVFAECSWVHGENQQGIDRLHRMGQQNGVLAEFIVAPGSISEKILANSLRKGQSVHKALDALVI